jgi:hypothetical protein
VTFTIGLCVSHALSSIGRGFRGEAYWLYIVEHAGDTDRAGLLRIQDPAGKARNFAFDQGWRQIADLSDGNPEGCVPSKTETC